MDCRLSSCQAEASKNGEGGEEDIQQQEEFGFETLGFCSTSWNWNLSYKNFACNKKINETSFKPGLRTETLRQEKVVRSRRFATIRLSLVIVVVTLFFALTISVSDARQTTSNGIFVQLPYSSPPTVRPPPYAESSEMCPAMNVRENWLDTICGDLNRGYIPSNPLGHKFPDGSSYPFEIIKNKTLQFFRHALPVLKSDKSLPKVARFNPYEDYQLTPPLHTRPNHRTKRSPIIQENLDEQTSPNSTERVEGRASQISRIRFCENPASFGGLSYFNRLCKMYHTMWGRTPHMNHNQYHHHQQLQQQQHQQRFDNSPEGVNNKRQYPHRNYMPQQQQFQYEALHQSEQSQQPLISAEANMPATPCPSSAEYLTPVFARNHEGAWRYVVQIPREGYFTQTVEVTKCSEQNCYYMDGSCRTSPRWQSLLVAEMFYPDKAFPLNATPAGSETEQIADFQKFQRYIQKRKAKSSGNGETIGSGNDLSVEEIPPQCDGLDEIGCFQVRLFYDWFLIPGSCKCWRRQFDFTRVHQSRR